MEVLLWLSLLPSQSLYFLEYVITCGRLSKGSLKISVSPEPVNVTLGTKMDFEDVIKGLEMWR